MTKPAQTWALLLEAFHASLSIQNLAFATVGTLAMVLSWSAVDYIVAPDDSPETLARNRVLSSFTSNPPWPNQFEASHLTLPENWGRAFTSQLASDAPIDPFDAVWDRLINPIRQMFVTGNTWRRLIYLLLGSLSTIAIWSFFGLAITRNTALRCAGHKSISFQTAIQFARARAFDLFTAVTLPLLGIALMAIPAVVLGWTMNWEVGFLVAGVVWIAVVLISSLMAVLGIGMIAGWPLMWGAISSENADGFDAISRSYAYTFQRPLHFLLYVLLASLIGKFGWFVAWIFSAMVINFSFWIVEIGCGANQIELLQTLVAAPYKPPETSNTLWTGATMIRQVIGFVHCVASAYSFSFLWSAAAAIYLLLRRDTDQTEIDDVFVGSQQPTPE